MVPRNFIVVPTLCNNYFTVAPLSTSQHEYEVYMSFCVGTYDIKVSVQEAFIVACVYVNFILVSVDGRI